MFITDRNFFGAPATTTRPERGKWGDLKTRGGGQSKESADKKGGPAGLKPGLQQKTGLVGKRKLQPYAPHGAERTN